MRYIDILFIFDLSSFLLANNSSGVVEKEVLQNPSQGTGATPATESGGPASTSGSFALPSLQSESLDALGSVAAAATVAGVAAVSSTGSVSGDIEGIAKYSMQASLGTIDNLVALSAVGSGGAHVGQYAQNSRESLDSIMKWSARVLEGVREIRWQTVGYERLANGKPDPAKPLFSMANPNTMLDKIVAEFSGTVLQSLHSLRQQTMREETHSRQLAPPYSHVPNGLHTGQIRGGAAIGMDGHGHGHFADKSGIINSNSSNNSEATKRVRYVHPGEIRHQGVVQQPMGYTNGWGASMPMNHAHHQGPSPSHGQGTGNDHDRLSHWSSINLTSSVYQAGGQDGTWEALRQEKQGGGVGSSSSGSGGNISGGYTSSEGSGMSQAC